jgi:hypothetical protein
MPLAIPTEPPVAGLLIEVVSAAVALLVGLSGLLGGAAHYLSVFAGGTRRQVEVRTGAGFFVGMVFGIPILLLDSFV